MRSNPIGTGTRNLRFNAPVDWALDVGRAAAAAGLSLGEWLRRKVEVAEAVENPERAARLRQIRRQYYGAALAVIFSAGMVAAWFSHDEMTLRRCRRARARTEQIELEEEI